jgi:hypothetical protein
MSDSPSTYEALEPRDTSVILGAQAEHGLALIEAQPNSPTSDAELVDPRNKVGGYFTRIAIEHVDELMPDLIDRACDDIELTDDQRSSLRTSIVLISRRLLYRIHEGDLSLEPTNGSAPTSQEERSIIEE